MRNVLRFRPSPAMVVAALALMIVLGGTASAAGLLITGKQIKNGSVTGKDIKNRSLGAKDLKLSALGGGGATAMKMGRAGVRNFTNINSANRTEVATVSVNAPSDGFMSLTYSATIGNATPGTWLDVFLMEDGERINGNDEWWDPGDNDGNWD